MVKHLFSNGLIEIIYSITWIDDIYLEHCASWGFLPSLLKQRYSFTDGGSFNDVFGVGKICRCRVGWSLIWTWVVVVFGSFKSVSLWLCFLGVEKYCESWLLLTSVSTIFLVVRFDTSEGRIRTKIDTPQSPVVSFFDDYIESCGKNNAFWGST